MFALSCCVDRVLLVAQIGPESAEKPIVAESVAILLASAAPAQESQACHDARLHDVCLCVCVCVGRLILPHARSCGRRAADIHVTLPSLAPRSAAGLGRPKPGHHLRPRTGPPGCGGVGGEGPPRPAAPP